MLSTRLILVFLMLIIGESRSIIYGGRELNKYELASIKYLEEVMREDQYVRIPCDPAGDGEVCCCPKKAQHGQMLKQLFQTPNFRITVVEDAHTVELCGALKNIVACAAGFTDGLGYGDNTKAAVIRLGLMETTKFVEHYYPGSNLQTFFESCGVADLITTCYGGRNRKVCEAFVKQKKSLAEIEKELLNGQSAQGPLTAEEVYLMMEKTGLHEKFPLFTAVHKICKGDMKPESLIDCLRNHPEHMEL
uniref:glycerol-3-phosphate dehydrogenase (NAD(+)) n=1 Tax=Pristionchus pacificus TaxID=54126 RepID=A0A2A6BJE8_PRIPA|eukprot:PDM65921.1 gpdh-2 protein [Pristionchus pacificus]